MTSAAKRGILYAVLALCLMGFCYVQGKAAAVDELTVDRAQSLLGGSRIARRLQDSLGEVSRKYLARADSLAKHPRYVQVVTAHHDTVQVWDTVWVAQQVTDLRGAYSACSVALTLCKARSDSLEMSLAAVLKVKACHVLFLPCPSRGALFVLGAVGGALLEHRLTH